MHVFAKPNSYQQAYPAYDRTPKAVLAAIAYSLALRVCGDDPTTAERLLLDEWATLHQNGIVPQTPGR